MKNTKITYMYRDADNYKTYSPDLVLEGEITKEQISILLSTYGEGNEGFIPSQIKLRDLQVNLQAYDSEDYDVDHCWHELTEIELTNDSPTSSMSAVEFFKAIMNTEWKPFEPGHILN